MDKIDNHPPLRTALIGVSGYGKAHLRGIQALQLAGKIQLTAATVINREEEANTCDELEKSGCRIYSDFREMIDSEQGRLDLCCIPTGIAWHCPMTLAALESGCHVLVEKPVAGTLSEVDAMIAARDQAQRRVFVGFHHLYQDPTQRIKRMLLEGRIGKIQSIRVMGCWPRSAAYYSRNNWAGRIRVGDEFVYDSPANNAFAHYLVAALYFAGSELHGLASVDTMEAELYRARPIESFDTICARLITTNGVDVHYAVTHSGQTHIEPKIEVIGTEGRILWACEEQFSIQPGGTRIPSKGGAKNQREMFEKIVSAIDSGEPDGCSLEMGREHTRIINEIHARFQILQVPERFLTERVEGNERFTDIGNIENDLKRSFETRKLFSELRVPWATSALST